MLSRSLSAWVPIMSLLAASACGSSDDGDGGNGDSVADAGGGVDADVGEDSDASLASEEICNGIDDDLNGKIDDIDVDGDGICDCLLIATLGIPGVWGDGDVFSDWLAGKSDIGVTQLTPPGEDPEITPELLLGFQIIVVEDVSVLNEFSEAEVGALSSWVANGGGLMTLIGYANETERTNVNTLLAPMELAYGSQGILAGSPTIAVDDFWADHPVTQAITAVGVDNGYPVEDLDGTGTVIAREGGHVVAIAKSHGSGKVFAWGDEWITYDSEWAQTNYQVEQFWLNLIHWLTPELECEIDNVIL
jgi:hypothetical protein